jgi:hypothetical protein
MFATQDIYTLYGKGNIYKQLVKQGIITIWLGTGHNFRLFGTADTDKMFGNRDYGVCVAQLILTYSLA